MVKKLKPDAIYFIPHDGLDRKIKPPFENNT